MPKHSWTTLPEWLGGLALVLVSGALAWADGPPEKPEFFLAPPNAAVAVEHPRLSDYWIGLACLPASEAMRAQLGLEENQGLVVESVVADSPAQKAGIHEHDVLVTAGGKRLEKVQDLIDAVDGAKESKLTLELYRGARQRTIDVTPTRRPEEARMPRGAAARQQYWDALRDYLDQFRPGQDGRPPMRFRLFHPGTVLPPGSHAGKLSLPGDMAISITKEGDEPAKIKVKKGDQTWEVTEDNLDKLPDEVRRPVERMLGRLGPSPGDEDETYDFDFDFFPDWQWQGRLPEGATPPKLHPKRPLEKQFEDLKRQMDQMRKSLEELRENRPRLRDPDARQKKTQQKT